MDRSKTAGSFVCAGFGRVHLWTLRHNGHTHTAFDYVENGTRVVCNPRGYIDRRTGRLENEQFAWDKVVEI
jgi:hypothetical protein